MWIPSCQLHVLCVICQAYHHDTGGKNVISLYSILCPIVGSVLVLHGQRHFLMFSEKLMMMESHLNY